MPNNTGKHSVLKSKVKSNSGQHGLPPKSASKASRREKSPGETLPSVDSANSGSTFESTSSQFQMMNITVSVNLLEGLIMESKGRFVEHNRNHTISHNSHSSQNRLPVTAIVSFLKNVSSCQTIATHLPSLPIGAPSYSERSKEYNFIARWPVDFDPDGDALSTLKISRLMRRDFIPIEHYAADSNDLKLGFVAEEIELVISLMQGSEMLTLGKANLVITGEENQEMVVDLPVNNMKSHEKENKEKLRQRSPSPFRRSASPFRRNTTKQATKNSKALKRVSFTGDPKKRYRLSEHAVVRVQVQVIPQFETAQDDDLEFESNENLSNNHDSRNINQYEQQRTNQSIPSTISRLNAISMEENIPRRGRSGSRGRRESNYGKSIHKPADYYGRDVPAPAPSPALVPTHIATKIRSKQNPITTKNWSPESTLQLQPLSNSLGTGFKSVPKVITPRTKHQVERFHAHHYSNRGQSKEAYRKKLKSYAGHQIRSKDQNDGKRTLVPRLHAQQAHLQQVASPSEKVANWLFSWGGEEEHVVGRERSTHHMSLYERYGMYGNKNDKMRDGSSMSMGESDEDDKHHSSSFDNTESSDEDTTYDKTPNQTPMRRGRSPTPMRRGRSPRRRDSFEN